MSASDGSDQERGSEARTPNPHAQSLDDDPDDREPVYDPITLERIGTRVRTPEPPKTARDIEIEQWLEAEFAKADARRVARERSKRLAGLAKAGPEPRAYPLQLGEERGTSAPISTRLPRWLERQVRVELGACGVGVSDGLRQIIEEWWVERRYPALEYRDSAFLRLAAVRGGPSIIEWFCADPRPYLVDEVREQVLDYVDLFRARLLQEQRQSPSSSISRSALVDVATPSRRR